MVTAVIFSFAAIFFMQPSQAFSFLLLSIFTRLSWMPSVKKSFTEQPARPDDAHAQAQAQDDAQAQDEAHDEAQDEAQEERKDPPPPERGRLTGTLTTLTRI